MRGLADWDVGDYADSYMRAREQAGVISRRVEEQRRKTTEVAAHAAAAHAAAAAAAAAAAVAAASRLRRLSPTLDCERVARK
jgi:hypothetical protein